MTKKLIYFLAIHRPNRSPSQRFRQEQYLPFLRSKNYNCVLKWIIEEEDEKGFYYGSMIEKLFLFMKSTIKLIHIIYKIPKGATVFIQREVYFLGTSFFEQWIAKKATIVFDFDDSIWLPNISNSNKKLHFLKNADKTKSIIKMAKTVIAGNPYLAEYALNYNSNVIVIPTVIDTEVFKPATKKTSDIITIGWSGSHSTIEHFESAIPVLIKIKNKYKDRVQFKVMGDANYINEILEIKGIPWSTETEIGVISSFDIGLMPLPDNEWTQGKCGFKGLQYMALSIPAILSPVGVNKEIIQDGINGFLANKDEEWLEKLSLLIENPDLRDKIGKAGRETVIEKYSLEANKNTYLQIFESVANK